MADHSRISVPRHWPDHVKSGVLHAISLANFAIAYARGRTKTRRRLGAEFEQATSEIAPLREELGIKDDRWQRSHSRRRPHYAPTQRMRILKLRAARGWTLECSDRLVCPRGRLEIVRHVPDFFHEPVSQ